MPYSENRLVHAKFKSLACFTALEDDVKAKWILQIIGLEMEDLLDKLKDHFQK